MPVLDTTFVVDLLCGEAAAKRTLALLAQGTRPLGVTPFTHYELYRGLALAGLAPEEERRVDDFLQSIVLFPFEPEAAKHAGMLASRLAERGRPLPHVDLLIGAIAMHHGEPVVTRNRRDFVRIPGLEVLAY